MSKWALAGLLAAAGTAWLALARPNGQDDDRRPPSAPLIKLNVAAVDARGQSVADLTREDFQVFDGAKLQPIASFRATISNRCTRFHTDQTKSPIVPEPRSR